MKDAIFEAPNGGPDCAQGGNQSSSRGPRRPRFRGPRGASVGIKTNKAGNFEARNGRPRPRLETSQILAQPGPWGSRISSHRQA
jgi:hypothetical protein